MQQPPAVTLFYTHRSFTRLPHHSNPQTQMWMWATAVTYLIWRWQWRRQRRLAAEAQLREQEVMAQQEAEFEQFAARYRQTAGGGAAANGRGVG